MPDKRIIDYNEAESLSSDDYLIIDGNANGTRKIKPNQLQVATDKTLSIENSPADAKAVGDQLNGVKADLNEIVNVTYTIPIDMSYGYIDASGATVDVTAVVASPLWQHGIIDCSEGDEFTINANSGNGPRAYCFIDNDGNSLLVADANVTINDLIITAPVNAQKLIVQSNAGLISYNNIKAPISDEVKNLKNISDALVSEETISEWQRLHYANDAEQSEGLAIIAGYIRPPSGSYPGRISSKTGSKTYWFLAHEEIQLYMTGGVGPSSNARLRVTTEQPVTGNSQPFTGNLYATDDGTMPTADNPIIVPEGKYVAFHSTASSYYMVLYKHVDEQKYVLAPTVEMTEAMKAELTEAVKEVFDSQAAVLRNSYDKIDIAWGKGNFTITTGADIRGSLDSSASRKSSPVICVPYPVAIGNDLNYRLRLSIADSSYAITSTGSFSEGTFTVIPANIPFRVTIRNDGDTDITAVTDETVNEHIYFYALFPNGYAPVKWCAMGDSITQGWYSEMSGTSAVNYTDASKVWASKVAIINGWRLTNLGRGSTGWLDPVNAGDYTTSGFYVARNTDFSSYDLVTLAYGINDWKANRVVGSYEDAPVDGETPTTVMQAMRATIEAIMASNPNCKIIVILPLNCIGYSYNYGTKATNYGLGYEFTNSGTLESFVQKMIEVCNYYGIQYIDQTHYSCINRENLRTMLPDGVHPSVRAHTLLAHELSKKITF